MSLKDYQHQYWVFQKINLFYYFLFIKDTEEGRYNDGEQKENVCSICLNKMEIGTTDIETNLKNEIQTKVGNEMPKAETTPKNETGEIGEENKMENDVTDDDSKNVDPDKLKTLQNCQVNSKKKFEKINLKFLAYIPRDLCGQMVIIVK